MNEKNTTRFVSGFLACFFSVVITQIVHLCFVGTTLLFLLGVTLNSVLTCVPMSSLKKATIMGQRGQAGLKYVL